MRRFYVPLMAVLLLGACFIAIGSKSTRRCHWEYAEFITTFDPYTCIWATSEKHIVARNEIELCKKLGVGTEKAALCELAFLNHIGAQGWELVVAKDVLNTDTMIFKRPI
jgi:hypothetical protein